MSAVPAANARRIGDILLELGFASADALTKASIEQEKTGQPLGQILVNHGAITRLELASALAEQWSDESSSIKLLPIPPPASAPRRAPESHHDDDQYAARLQDAVAELALRVGAGVAEPAGDFDDRVTDLAERVEATVARIQRIEATLATLAESFEGVTGGVEEAFNGLQAGMAGLALDLARIDTTVAELGTKSADAPVIDPVIAAQLDELGLAVAALSERPVADPELAGRLDAIADRVHSLVEATETPDPTLAARIEAISDAVTKLAERPFVDPAAIEARLDALADEVEAAVGPAEVGALRDLLLALEQRLSVLTEDAATAALDERLAAKPDSSELEALAARLDLSADEHESLATAVAQLGVRLDEMTWRDDGAARRLEELHDRIESVSTTLTNAHQLLATGEDAPTHERLDELGQSLAAVREEIAALARSVAPADRIDEIAKRVDDLAAERDAGQKLVTRLDEIEGRLPAEVVTPDDLARALAGARDELTPAPAPLPDPRVNRLAEDISEIQTRLVEVGTAPQMVADPGVQGQLEALASRLDQITADRAAEAALVAKLAGSREELEALTRRIEELPAAAEPHDDAPLVAKLEELERRLEAPGSVDPRLDQLDQLAHELESLREQVAKVERTPVTDPVVTSELDTLSARLRFLDDRVSDDVATSSEVTRAVDALRAELESTGAAGLTGTGTSQLESTLAALVARVDGLAESVATGAVSTARPAADELQRTVDERVEAKVTERLAELTFGLEERLAAAETLPRMESSGSGDTSVLEDLLERNRMTIERLGLHLGEHDRALAELMRSRNLPKKLDELAARVDEIAGGAASAGAPQAPGARREIGSYGATEPSTGAVKALTRRIEDAEIATQADREKLMNRLERMASSIDWRLQRLEAAETATAPQQD